MTESTGPARVRLHRDAPRSDDIDRDELLDLYRLLIDEYRFQVKLNSDRTQIYLVLNAAIIAAATGLFKVGGANASPLVTAIFVLGAVVAFLAAEAVKQGHSYYRAVIYKKTLVEDLLGRHRHIEGYAYQGANLAIETTAGMADERKILDDAEAWLSRPIRATITRGLILVFQVVALVDLIAALYSFASMMGWKWLRQ
jgi:hypothetical protein